MLARTARIFAARSEPNAIVLACAGTWVLKVDRVKPKVKPKAVV
jgi:hypothetical protein